MQNRTGFYDAPLRLMEGHGASDTDSGRPLPPLLADAAARLERGWELRKQLVKEANVFAGSDAHRLDPTHNKDGSEWVYVVRFDPKPDHRRFGVLLGDILQNLRSTLDYLAWQLVEHTANEPPKRATDVSFPIYSDAVEFERNVDRRLPGVRKDVVDRVRHHQPFSLRPDRPQATTPWMLNTLAKHDRHRLIRVSVLTISEADENRIDGVGSAGEAIITTRPVDGGPLLKLRPVMPTLEPPKVRIRLHYGLSVLIPLESPPSTLTISGSEIDLGSQPATAAEIGGLVMKLGTSVETIVHDFAPFLEAL